MQQGFQLRIQTILYVTGSTQVQLNTDNITKCTLLSNTQNHIGHLEQKSPFGTL